MSDFYFAQGLSDSNMTLEEMIEDIENVTIDSISEAFEGLELDTVYFLRN